MRKDTGRGKGQGAPRPTSATPRLRSDERKHIPDDILPRHFDEFRRIERESGWKEAVKCAREWQSSEGYSKDFAISVRQEWGADRAAQRGAKERREPPAIDFDGAYRLLFPWAPPELALAPCRWPPGSGCRGGDLPKPKLAIDYFIYHMQLLERGYGRLRRDVEATGFDCFYLAARAGIYRATVAAALEQEIVDARRRDGGTISRLEMAKSEAERLSREIAAFMLILGGASLSEGNGFPSGQLELLPKTLRNAGAMNAGDFIPWVQRGRVSPDPWDVARRRGDIVAAVNQCKETQRGLDEIALLAAEEIGRFTPPTKNDFTWAIAFAESLAGTWRELTGKLPAERSFASKKDPRHFNMFVGEAYKTVAPEGAQVDWEATVRSAVKNVKARCGNSGVDEDPGALPTAAAEISFEAWWRSVWPYFGFTQPSCTNMTIRAEAILHFEAMRRAPKWRPFVERLIETSGRD